MLLATLALCALSLSDVQARGRGHGHAFDRPAGRALAHTPTRRERDRYRFGDHLALTDISTSAAEVTARIEQLRAQGARVTLVRDGRGDASYFSTGKGYPVYRIDVPAEPGSGPDRARQRSTRGGTSRDRPLKVLLSAWIHGNEPVGPVVGLDLVERALRDKSFRQRFDLTLTIKIDPFGARTTPEGVNLNRRFGTGRWTPVTRDIAKGIDDLRPDLFVDLHGASLWSPKPTRKDGFFLIRGTDDGKLSRRILAAMPSAALRDASAEDARIGAYRFHAVGGATSDNAATFKGYMAARGVPYSYTLEAPRRLDPKRQHAGMLRLLRSTLDNVRVHGKW